MLEYKKKEISEPMSQKDPSSSTDHFPTKELSGDNSKKKTVTPETVSNSATSPEEVAFLTELLALSTTDLMIKEGVVSTRAFTLYDGKTIVAFLIRELEDSFVLVLPVILMNDREGNVLTGFLNQQSSMFRLYKNSIISSYVPSIKQLLCFLMTAESRFSTLPGYFDRNRVDQIRYMVKVLRKEVETELGEVKVIAKSNPEQRSESFEVKQPEDDSDRIKEISPKLPRSKYKH